MERTGAEDLEGIAHLNEKMKPTPSEKAQVIINPPEVSEEVCVIAIYVYINIYIYIYI